MGRACVLDIREIEVLGNRPPISGIFDAGSTLPNWIRQLAGFPCCAAVVAAVAGGRMGDPPGTGSLGHCAPMPERGLAQGEAHRAARAAGGLVALRVSRTAVQVDGCTGS